MPLKISYSFDPIDIQKISDIVSERKQLGRRLVIERIQRNIEGEPPLISEEELWFAMMMCLLTTQQPSGPNDPVPRFLLSIPFRLSLPKIRQSENIPELVKKELSDFGGIRFYNRIADETYENFSTLEAGGWSRLEYFANALSDQRRTTPEIGHLALEQEAAEYMSANYRGIGPKQSRNFWQYLGLTRFVFVLDGRVIKWLHKNIDFGALPLSTDFLSDEKYYRFVSGILLNLCEQVGVLPCLFDAVIFDSYDPDEWQGYI